MKHGMFQRSISLLLALVMILGNMPVNAWATETEETPAPACAHSYEAVTTAEATCTEAGTVVYTCGCGDTYTETVAATGHSYAAETTAAATCTEAGTVVYTCGCGDTYTETVAATGHSFSDWTVEAEATYEAAGSRTRVCAVCSAVETEVIPQLQKEAVSGETRKIYFLNTEEWDEVYVRWFFDEEKYADASFPGEKLDEDKDLEAVYVIEVPVEADAVTFNDGVEVTAELLAWEDENDIEAIHFFEAELNAELDYFSAAEQVADEENATEWLSYEDLHKAWEEAKKAEEDADKQPVMDNAPQGETTDPAQALIDSLPATVNSQEEYDAVYAIVDQLEQAGYINGLTDEQLARAMDAINAADLWYAGEEAGNYDEAVPVADGIAAGWNSDYSVYTHHNMPTLADLQGAINSWGKDNNPKATTKMSGSALGRPVTYERDVEWNTADISKNAEISFNSSVYSHGASLVATAVFKDYGLNIGIAKVSGNPTYTKSFTLNIYDDVIVNTYVNGNLESSATTPVYRGASFSGTVAARTGYTVTVENATTYDATTGAYTVSGLDEDRTVNIRYAAIPYEITWDAGEGVLEDGNKTKTETLNYGTLLNPPKATKENASFKAWTPAIAEGTTVTGKATYTATYTNDSIWEVIFNDGAADKAFYVNATQNETLSVSEDGKTITHNKADGTTATYTLTDAADNNKMFTGWDKAVASTYTADTTYTAQWIPDTNNNDVADSAETITVNFANATVTVDGNTVNSGVPVLYKSNEGATVVITPADGYYVEADATGTYSGRKLTISIPATEGNNRHHTVNVTAAKPAALTLPATAEIGVNAYGLEKLDGIEALVLTNLIGEGYNAEHYNVEYQGLLDWWYPVEISVTMKIGDTNNFRVIYNPDSSKYPNVTSNVVAIKISDNREDADIQSSYKTSSFNTEDEFKAAFAASVTFNGKTPDFEGLTELDRDGQISWTTNEDGTYTASVEAHSKEGWKKTTKTFTGLTWTVNQYAVSFKDWDDTVILAAKNYPYGTLAGDIEVPANPSRTGYTFNGWNPTVADVTGEQIYQATYGINTYTVTFMNGEDKVSEETLEYGATITAPAAPEKEGHTFAGWDANGDKVADTVDTVVGAANVTYTALWNVNSYDVIWVWQNGEQSRTQTLPYGTAIVVPAEIPTQYKVGNVTYTRTGWTGLVDGATVPVNGITYTATYTTATAWIVDFDSNGGSEVVDVTVIVPEGETAVVAKPADPTREGYRFDGWQLNGEDYDFATPVTADITLKAKWVKLVTVSFDVEGEDYKDQTFDINGAATKPADPTKDQAIFGGWYLGETEYDFATPVTEDISLTAKWIADTNSNKVPDEDETIQVTIVGNGSVNGKTENFTAIYNSADEDAYALNIVPAMENGVSKSYVSSVKICDEEQTLTYNADYSVALAANKEKNEVLVTFADAAFTFDEEGQMRFYVGMQTPEYETLYNAVITNPEYNETAVKSVKYLARPAATYQMQVPVLFEYTIPLINYTIKIGGNVVDLDLDDAWLDVGESFKTLTPEALQAQYDTEIQKIKDKIAAIDLSDISWSNAWDKVQQFDTISEELTTLISTITNEAQYLGYHQFGASGLVDENGNAQEKLQVIYESEAMRLVDENVYVTLVDDRIATTITSGDLTFEYDEFTDADILGALRLVDANGNVIDGELIKSVDLAGTKVGTRTYTVTYAGSRDYKPATATFTLTVIKAPSSTDIVNQTVTYGSAYSAAPVITNKHGKTIDLDAVEFFLGLDVADLDVDGDGVKGLEGRMQLILTKELQTILSMVGLEEGAELNISDLINALTNTGLLEQWGISSEMVDALKGVLDSINGAVETNNLMITIGGNYPTDIGAYLHGAVTVDANYETSFDVGYLIIKPDAQRAYLNWNYTDSNGIFTQQLLTSENLGASAYDDAAFTVLNETATAQVQNLFLGFDENGEVVLELFAQNSDPNAIAQALGNGGYTQLAFVAEFGNELYYAVPIARAFAIIPGVTKLDIIVDGQPSADLYKTVFDNAPVDVTVNGQIPEDSQVKLHYYGIEANTHTYESDIAPTHTGAYAITATLLARDGETGELTTVGLDVATVVIQPTESSVTMKELQTVVFDGESHNVADTMEITASSTVENLEPDTTVITASIATDGSFSENGWAAVKGTVNVDFPRWMDELISKYAPSVKNGITLSQLENRLLNKLPVIAEKMEELGATNEMVNSAKNLLNNVAALLEEMPADATLSFKDNYEVLAVGTYAVAAVVTDSDHIPSVAAGLMVIVPDADQVFLDWDYHDENNIWSRELLSSVSINATAFNDKAFTEPNEQATGKITYQFIGLDQNAGLKIYTDPAQLPNGIYTQIAYIELEVDSQIILSDIIARTIMIVPNMPELQIVDVNGAAQNKFEFTFDNEPVELYVNQNGTRIENEIRYIGLQTNGVEYDCTVAPVHAGVYTAITVVKTQENVGMDVALVTIAPAKSTISVTGGTVPYNGKEQTATVKAESPNSTVTSPDYILISGTVDISAGVQNIGLESLHGDVNIDLPKWLDDVLAKTDFNRVDADVASLANAISAYRDDLMNLIPEQVLEQIAMSNETLADIIKKVNSGIDELLKVLEKLPDDVHLTFENNKGYSELGSYFYYGIVADSDHIPAADTGLLVIEPAAITSVEVASEYVYNGQAQTAAVVVKAGDVELSEDCYTISGNVATDAGKYTLTVTGTGNYSGTVTVEWTIAKAAATVTVDNKTAIYGEAIPEFTATIVGVFAGDTLEITYTCENNGELGTYPVTAVVAEHKNYDVTVISGTLTIKEKVEDDQKTGFQIIIEEPELVDKIVEIDGIEYQLVDGKLIISEDTAKQWMAEGTKLMTAYAYKEDASDVHKEYPTAMYVWVLTYDTKSVDNAVVINEVRAVRIKELDNYMMYEGTSIRINFVNDAIRFFTSVTPGGYSGLKNGTLLNNTGTALDGAKMLEMGTRAKKFNAEDRNLTIAYGTGDIVFGAGANADGQATDGLRKYGDGTRYVTKEACYLFTGAMENLPTSKKNLNLEFVVRPYVTLQLQNGQTTTLYGGKYQRTISYVAYQNQSFMAGTAYNAYIQNIINISGIDRTTGKIS